MSESERIDGASLEAEAHALEDVFNDAAPDYAPELEWHAMTTLQDGEGQAFIFEAERYADRDGLAAFREAGRTVTYIEAYEYGGEETVVLEVPVQGETPESQDTETAQDGGRDE